MKEQEVYKSTQAHTIAAGIFQVKQNELPLSAAMKNPRSIEQKVQLAQIVVAQATNVPLELICAPTRSKPLIAQARQIAMYLTHVALGVSLTKTAEGFRRDRTTASHACKVVEELRDNPQFDFQLSQLEEGLAKIALRSWQGTRPDETRPREARPEDIPHG